MRELRPADVARLAAMAMREMANDPWPSAKSSDEGELLAGRFHTRAKGAQDTLTSLHRMVGGVSCLAGTEEVILAALRVVDTLMFFYEMDQQFALVELPEDTSRIGFEPRDLPPQLRELAGSLLANFVFSLEMLAEREGVAHA